MAWENISKELQKDKPKVIYWKRWAVAAAAVLIPALVSVGILLNNSEETLPQITWQKTDTPAVSAPAEISPESVLEQKEHFSGTHIFNSEKINSENVSRREIANSGKSVQQQNGSNRLMNFIDNFWNETSVPDSDFDYKFRNQRKKDQFAFNRKPNIFSALTAPFQQNNGRNNERADLYASLVPEEGSVLKVTALNASEEKSSKKDIKEFKNKNLKFEISPYAGAAMLGSFDQQSLLAPEFNGYQIDTKMASMYGSKAAYKINDRIKVRTGVGVIDMRQTTYEVPFRVNNAGSNLTFNMRSSSNISPDLSGISSYENSIAAVESQNTQHFNHSIEQNLRMIEVPLEMEYKFTKGKKLNVSGTAGASTLFNRKNDVYLADSKSLVGEATNVKSVSFSANAGVKMDYKISEKISVNIEPQMKYMINTITSNDEVQPYLLGVNAGFTYSL